MSKRSEWQLIPLLLGVSVIAIACGGGGGSGPPPDNMTIEATAVAGNEQTGRVGEVLVGPLLVAVTEDGQPAAGVMVTWATTAAGGVVIPATGTTDADGIASSTWTLGTTPGAQTARATVSGASGSPVTFTATAVAGNAATIEKAGGDGQTGEINTDLALPVQARVEDQFGNGVDGVSVNWSATGAAVSAPTVASNATGLSQVSVTLGGTEGPITIVAEASALTGSPLTFSATAVIPTPAPTSIGITVGNDFFRSDRNNSSAPAVDTLAVGGTATWTWSAGAVSHNVTPTGVPSFTGSPTASAPASHSFTFLNAGTYRYYCTVHAAPSSQFGMVGRIVVR
jgi:plastocyanin